MTSRVRWRKWRYWGSLLVRGTAPFKSWLGQPPRERLWGLLPGSSLAPTHPMLSTTHGYVPVKCVVLQALLLTGMLPAWAAVGRIGNSVFVCTPWLVAPLPSPCWRLSSPLSVVSCCHHLPLTLTGSACSALPSTTHASCCCIDGVVHGGSPRLSARHSWVLLLHWSSLLEMLCLLRRGWHTGVCLSGCCFCIRARWGAVAGFPGLSVALLLLLLMQSVALVLPLSLTPKPVILVPVS